MLRSDIKMRNVRSPITTHMQCMDRPIRLWKFQIGGSSVLRIEVEIGSSDVMHSLSLCAECVMVHTDKVHLEHKLFNLKSAVGTDV